MAGFKRLDAKKILEGGRGRDDWWPDTDADTLLLADQADKKGLKIVVDARARDGFFEIGPDNAVLYDGRKVVAREWAGIQAYLKGKPQPKPFEPDGLLHESKDGQWTVWRWTFTDGKKKSKGEIRFLVDEKKDLGSFRTDSYTHDGKRGESLGKGTGEIAAKMWKENIPWEADLPVCPGDPSMIVPNGQPVAKAGGFLACLAAVLHGRNALPADTTREDVKTAYGRMIAEAENAELEKAAKKVKPTDSGGKPRGVL